MRWKGRRQSANIFDRRGRGGGGVRVVGGIGGLGAVAVIVLALLFGVDPMMLLEPQDPATVPQGQGMDDDTREFVAVVLGDTEDVWAALFERAGETYRPASLVLYTQGTRSGCGLAAAAIGPFYCPADQRIYLDPVFFRELEQGLGATGDFARAYVIAHEVGHHVQYLLGILDEVHGLQSRVSETEANRLSVQLELQADCFAGIWSHHADRMHGIIEEGDIDEALGAASRIGDDALQRRSQGYVVPDSFTHGTSAQRVEWFRRGYDSGRVADCDTFSAPGL